MSKKTNCKGWNVFTDLCCPFHYYVTAVLPCFKYGWKIPDWDRNPSKSRVIKQSTLTPPFKWLFEITVSCARLIIWNVIWPGIIFVFWKEGLRCERHVSAYCLLFVLSHFIVCARHVKSTVGLCLCVCVCVSISGRPLCVVSATGSRADSTCLVHPIIMRHHDSGQPHFCVFSYVCWLNMQLCVWNLVKKRIRFHHFRKFQENGPVNWRCSILILRCQWKMSWNVNKWPSFQAANYSQIAQVLSELK